MSSDRRAEQSESNPPRRVREVAPDLLKGGAAFGVVCIHGSGAIGRGAVVDAIVDGAMLAVPIFVIVWGYNVARSWRPGTAWWPWVKRVYVRLLPPFLFWSLFYQILSGDLFHPGVGMVTRHWIGWGWPGQYYFVLLMLTAPFVPLLMRVAARSGAAVAAIMALTAALYLAVSLHLYAPGRIAGQRGLPWYWFGYVVAGAWLARRERPFPAAIALTAVAVPLIRLIDPNYPRVFTPYCTLPVLVGALAIAAATLHRPIVPGRIGKGVAAVGRASLAVFVLNPLFAMVIGLSLRAGGLVVPLDWQVPVLLVAACIIVAAAIGLERVFVRLGLGRLVR